MKKSWAENTAGMLSKSRTNVVVGDGGVLLMQGNGFAKSEPKTEVVLCRLT